MSDISEQVHHHKSKIGEDWVGRDRELAELLAGLQDAAAGRGGLFLITGEPGIGKTALADRLAEHAAGRGARVLWGRSWEAGATAPYWLWTQLIRALADGLDDQALRSLVAPDTAAPLARLVPELAARVDMSSNGAATPDSDAGRFYLFEATSRLLTRAAAAQPLVLVLDDVLAADRPSQLLLRFLAGDLRAARLLVVATYRDGAGRTPEAEDLIADLVRDGGRLLRLAGLHQPEVERLIAAVSGTEPWPDKAAAIHQATEGNPLFVREVTRLVAATGTLDRPGRLSITVPDSVRAVIDRRLAPLSADAVQVLSAAAVVGRDFDLALVGAAADLPVERVLGSVSEAAALGAVQQVRDEPQRTGTYRFTHPLMREAIYNGLPLPARLQMHQRVGEAIERLPGAATACLDELAYHFGQVAATGEGARAAAYARRAADAAMRSYGYEEAAAQYRRALAAVPYAGLDDPERAELLLRLGSALARAGDYPQARESFLQAAALARTLAAAEPLARAALGYGEPQVDGGLLDQQLLALLREALDQLSPQDSPLRARLLARLSLELTFADDAELRETQRDSLSQQAVAMARRLDDVAARAIACRARWMAVWGPDGLTERMALGEEILRLARESGDRELELVGRARRATCAMEAGDLATLDTDLAAHARLAEQLRMPYHEWTAATIRAGRLLLEGSFEAAGQLAGRAVSLLPRRPHVGLAHLHQLTVIRWEQGRLAELRQAWQRVDQQFPQTGFAAGWLALASAEAGRAAEAGRQLRSDVANAGALPRDGLWPSALAASALAAARLGDPDAADVLYPLLLPYDGSFVVIPMPHPVMCFGSASLYLGVLAATMSRWDDAAGHFEAAVAANTRLGAGPWLAHSWYEYARMLVRRGRTADRELAQALVRQAEESARGLGMVALADGCAQLREQVGNPAVAPAMAPVVAPVVAVAVFRREGDFWTVGYDGSTVRLRDSKGMRQLARLLAAPGRELHAVDLAAADIAGNGTAPATERDELTVRGDLGDAGHLLDARAKAEYKARIDQLRDELAEAESFHDSARAARNKAEIEFIAGELARAVGLGGRDRVAASHAERARLNVTRAIRAAMANLARAHPSLGKHLAATVRTGRYCSYLPDPRAQPRWQT